ncbi:hypothetical protein Dimus_028006 [Dionaea muscipula]
MVAKIILNRPPPPPVVDHTKEEKMAREEVVGLGLDLEHRIEYELERGGLEDDESVCRRPLGYRWLEVEINLRCQFPALELLRLIFVRTNSTYFVSKRKIN